MLNEELKQSWTDEFSPQSLNDMVLNSEIKSEIENNLKSGTIFSYLFEGSAGIGKTSLANIIAKELNAMVLFIPCGLNGNVAYAQTTVKNFCDSLSMEGRPKMVIMDELDCASGTQENSFQKTMRNIISETHDCIFIGTCNYINKVIEPIQSRLGVKKLKFSTKELFLKAKYILDTKEIKYNNDSLKEFVNKILKTHYPDVRRIISDLQKCCSSGELIISNLITEDISFIDELINKCKNETNLLNLRQFYISNKSKIPDYIKMSSDIFNYILDNNLITTNDHVLYLSNLIYQMNLVIDKEISFFSFITYLNKILKNG
jgi:DNA polymerase III delta prime subunit